MKTKILLVSALLIVGGVINGCKKKSTNTPAPATNEVFIQNTAFTPASIMVSVNTTIKWTNKDAMAHTVTNNTGSTESFDSGIISSGSTYSHLFTTAGTFSYHCNIHSTMSGTVIVQ